jgi:predicted amidophosphoribosyltransferase
LVDDVVTTGTTLARASAVLGHQQVHYFAIAQVP